MSGLGALAPPPQGHGSKGSQQRLPQPRSVFQAFAPTSLAKCPALRRRGWEEALSGGAPAGSNRCASRNPKRFPGEPGPARANAAETLRDCGPGPVGPVEARAAAPPTQPADGAGGNREVPRGVHGGVPGGPRKAPAEAPALRLKIARCPAASLGGVKVQPMEGSGARHSQWGGPGRQSEWEGPAREI